MKKILPIGIDSFREIRESGKYYVDKTLLIRDFIKNDDKVTLITRPRRFGKTLNMTMLREFFDITLDSKAIFSGLKIMDTEYAGQINSRPVIYFTFKDCKESTAELLLANIAATVLKEYIKYHPILKENAGEPDSYIRQFLMFFEKLFNKDVDPFSLKQSIELLEMALFRHYKVWPIVLIDEYDQPIIASYEYGYHDEVKLFFSGFFGAALKGQDCLHQAMLTGIQRVVKESIFSQLNNVRVYTVVDEKYSGYFGLTEHETSELLKDYGLMLTDEVRQKYDGYLFCKTEMYNPWSVLNYADLRLLRSYWINTSTNALIRNSIHEARKRFTEHFDILITNEAAAVTIDLGCSFLELKHPDTLWGLLVNTGYITVLDVIDEFYMKVKIPNGEVRGEFQKIIADRANLENRDLNNMFRYLLDADMENFMEIYRELVISCTSYFDAKENAYHMLFLGMCISLNNLYKFSSNIESGLGRSDIRMESLAKERPHIIIEFKQGENLETLKEEALAQIMAKKYYDGLSGEILCIGIAHHNKSCSMAHEKIVSAKPV
jgi:hypothetical protein